MNKLLTADKRKGFTLVEIIVVLVILAVLAAIMIPSMTGWIDKAQQKQAYVELHTVALAAQSAYSEVYAIHPNMTDVGFITSSKGQTASQGADGTAFFEAFKGYLNDDTMLANTKSVMYQSGGLFITYDKDGTRYNYTSIDGKTTINAYEL